jgi:hypothetical protein
MQRDTQRWAPVLVNATGQLGTATSSQRFKDDIKPMEHRRVQELEANAAKQIEALTAGLQKVNAQLEVSKPAAQTVLNSQ